MHNAITSISRLPIIIPVSYHKLMRLLLSIIIAIFLASCTPEPSEPEKLVVGTVSGGVHEELLTIVSDNLADAGYALEIVAYSDHMSPNVDLASEKLDANYFQHIPFMDEYNAENGTRLISAGGIHIAGPLGVYSKKYKALEEIPEGAVVVIPDDAKNEGRALLLLQSAGLLVLRGGVGYEATVDDIIANPRDISIQKAPSAGIASILPDVDAAVLRGDDAISAGLSILSDSLYIETADSPYANVVAVRDGDEDLPGIRALVAALRSLEVREYIAKHYPDGSVIAAE